MGGEAAAQDALCRECSHTVGHCAGGCGIEVLHRGEWPATGHLRDCLSCSWHTSKSLLRCLSMPDLQMYLPGDVLQDAHETVAFICASLILLMCLHCRLQATSSHHAALRCLGTMRCTAGLAPRLMASSTAFLLSLVLSALPASHCLCWQHKRSDDRWSGWRIHRYPQFCKGCLMRLLGAVCSAK